MHFHRNAKLGLAGRYALVRAVEGGMSLRKAARRHGVGRPPPVPGRGGGGRRAWRSGGRWPVCLIARAGRAVRRGCCRRACKKRICAERRRSGHGPRPIAGRLGYAHATVWKALRRNGCSRPEPKPREPARRYEWPCPGDLLHVDWTTLRPFRRARPRGYRRPHELRREEAASGRLRRRARARR